MNLLQNNLYIQGMLNTPSTGCSAFHLPKTHHMRGQIFDIIISIKERNFYLRFLQKTSLTGQANNTISMIYTDLIELVGQYMTYEEFSKAHPEIELTHTDWYAILNGRTMRTHKKELKQRYLEEFNADWTNRRNVAFDLLQHAKETSN